jgi:hypothetical protein
MKTKDETRRGGPWDRPDGRPIQEPVEEIGAGLRLASEQESPPAEYCGQPGRQGLPLQELTERSRNIYENKGRHT